MTRAGRAVATEPRWLPAAALPGCLGDLSRPPAGLWLLGDPSGLGGAPHRHVAIVGTRDASTYGERTAAKLAAACTRAGLVVVSGMARGVDAAAHRAALAAGGLTVAVQGTGVDVPYPVGHRTLLREVAAKGTVISEMDPGAGATAGCFPRRNRLIAALCEVTVVVEAGFKSGAINTANRALDLGRTVAAVPGQIDDPRSAGANQLIRDGAQVVATVEDLLTLFGLSTIGSARSTSHLAMEQSEVSGGEVHAELVERLRAGAASAQELAESLGLPVRRISAQLLGLELSGIATRVGERFEVHG